MNQTPVEPGGTVPLSTTLDPQTVPLENGGGRIAPGFVDGNSNPDTKVETAKVEPKKPVSVRETLESVKADLDKEEADTKAKGEDAAKAAQAKADEVEDKQKSAAKPDKVRSDDGKFAKADNGDTAKVDTKAEQGAPEKAAAGQEGSERRQSEGQHREPPARFLPRAKEAWINAPYSVRADVVRMEQEHAQEIEQHRKASERYETIRDFDEALQKSGVQLRDRLVALNNLGLSIQKNPVSGLEMVLREFGPRKADGSPVSLYELAHLIAKQSPQQFQQTQSSALAQQQAQDTQSEARRLADENKQLRIQIAAQPVIAQFAATHPRYKELEVAIAGFLQVPGLIPASLSPEQKLAAAYDMAERISPRSVSPALQEVAVAPADAKPAPADEAGRKSIRGAPTGGEDPVFERPKQSMRELLTDELRRLQKTG